MFRFLSRLATGHAKWVVAFWALIFFAGLPLGLTVQKVLKGGGFDAPWKEYNRVKGELDKLFGTAKSTLLLEFDRPAGNNKNFEEEVGRVVAPLRRHGDVAYVRGFSSTLDPRFHSADGKGSLVVIGTHLDDFYLQQKLPELLSFLAPSKLTYRVTGAAPFNEALTDITRRDAMRGEMVAIPLVLFVLLWLFRSVPAALLPVGVAGVSIPVTLALVHLLGLKVELSLFLLNIASILGIGLAIDYALLIVSRYREERAAQRDPISAMDKTLDTAGRAVFFSALTVMVGISGMAFFRYMFMTSLALGGALVVGVSLAASLTLLPAVLFLMGPYLEKGKIPGWQGAHQKGLFTQMCAWALRFPVITLVLLVVALGVAGWPMTKTRLGTSHTEVLPRSSPPRAALERIHHEYDLVPRVGDLLVLVKPHGETPLDDPEMVGLMHRLAGEMLGAPGVQEVLSPVSLGGLRDLKTTSRLFETRRASGGKANPTWDRALESVFKPEGALFRLRTGYKPGDSEGEELVRALRTGGPPELDLGVTGEIPRLMDFSEDLYSRFPLAMAWVVGLTLLLLLLMFRSVVLPVKAVGATLVSMLAAFGAVVYIFQMGHFEKILRFSSPGYTEAVLPAVLFAVLFGLAMDYEVFLLARIKEVFDETGDNDKAVQVGVERTTGIITGAAVAMVVVAGGFALADLLPVKIIGIGIALAVFLDATLVRGLMVPAVMKLMGRWNWYLPGFLNRLLPQWKSH